MNGELQQIIRKSTFMVVSGAFIYAKVRQAPQRGDHFLITKDADEITVITQEEQLAELDLIEKNKDLYALIALNVSIPFYSVGFLAIVSEAIAKAGMNILIVSTYSKDYIMVRHDKLDEARTVLLSLGFQEAQ